MKKNLLRLLAGTMAVSMVLSLTACGGDDKSSSSSEPSSSVSTASSENSSSQVESAPEESSSEASSSEASSSEASSAAANGKYASIQDFLDDPSVKSQLDSMIESLTAGDDSMAVKVEGQDNKLVYTFTFVGEEFSEEEITTMHDALEAGMASQAATFEGIASSLSSAIEVSDPKVVVVYAAEDGTEIYSQEFDAK